MRSHVPRCFTAASARAQAIVRPQKVLLWILPPGAPARRGCFSHVDLSCRHLVVLAGNTFTNVKRDLPEGLRARERIYSKVPTKAVKPFSLHGSSYRT